MRPVVKSVLLSSLFVLFLSVADAATPKQKTSGNSTPAIMQMQAVVALFLDDGNFRAR